MLPIMTWRKKMTKMMMNRLLLNRRKKTMKPFPIMTVWLHYVHETLERKWCFCSPMWMESMIVLPLRLVPQCFPFTIRKNILLPLEPRVFRAVEEWVPKLMQHLVQSRQEDPVRHVSSPLDPISTPYGRFWVQNTTQHLVHPREHSLPPKAPIYGDNVSWKIMRSRSSIPPPYLKKQLKWQQRQETKHANSPCSPTNKDNPSYEPSPMHFSNMRTSSSRPMRPISWPPNKIKSMHRSSGDSNSHTTNYKLSPMD
mmetsp:Transcript_6065/g.8824  ORF Transcript_6065/g.8824 Transcript_6065/m.8824 type:complete len:254 (-) Transcript_6065:1591-2352(-)